MAKIEALKSTQKTIAAVAMSLFDILVDFPIFTPRVETSCTSHCPPASSNASINHESNVSIFFEEIARIDMTISQVVFSYYQGIDTSKEFIKGSAREHGYTHVCMHDMDAASGIMQAKMLH